MRKRRFLRKRRARMHERRAAMMRERLVFEFMPRFVREGKHGSPLIMKEINYIMEYLGY